MNEQPTVDPPFDGPRIIGGSPTASEIAAVAAVLAQLSGLRAASIEELAPEARGSAWERRVRTLRGGTAGRPRWTDPVL